MCFALSMFYFILFSTKRVDHSNTRLASQLDRNPGGSPRWILGFLGGWLFFFGGVAFGKWVGGFLFFRGEFSSSAFFSQM